MQVRCLHCHEPVELSDDSDFSSLTCPSCGSNFSLVGEQTVSYKAAQVRTIGHFELIDQVGIGAFGSVWKARDKELQRTVAVKIPRKGELDPEEAEQFLREARAAAQLRHPNIVGVHEVGREDDSVYIVSDFIDGATLDDWLTGQQLTAREAARLCAKIADALHHAHEAGVIHRDLKPGNIMLDLEGEPHLVDFGMARRTAGEVTMTVAGRILGTPAYMSPEQARGEGHQADRRTDIYSAGVVLFKLLTGELPFRGNPQMLIVQIQREEPPSPRKLNGRIPPDLETICLKCLEKNPDGRYATAAELAAELRRWLNGEPIQARPISAAARGWRWCRRNSMVASLMATAALLLIAVAVVASVGYAQVRGALGRESAALGVATTERDEAQKARHRETEQRVLAEQQRQKAIAQQNEAERARSSEEAAKERFRRQLYVSDMSLVSRAYADGSIERMNQLLEKHRPQRGAVEEDVRGFEWYYWWRAGHLHQTRIRNPTRGPFYRLAVSPDGKTVAAAAHGGSSIYLYDNAQVRVGKVPLGGTGFVKLSFSREGALLAVGGPGLIHIRNVADWREVKTIYGQSTTDPDDWGDARVSVAFSPTQPILATGGLGTPIRLWDVATWKRLGQFPVNGHVQCLAFAPDGTLIAGGMADGTVVICDVEAQQITETISAHQQPVTGVVYWPDGSLLATGSEDETIRLWDKQLEAIETLSARAPVKSLALSIDGKLLVAGTSKNNSVLVWNVESQPRTLMATIKGHSREVVGVAFTADTTLWSASDEGFIKTWDVSRGEPFDLLKGVPADTRLVYASDGRTLLFKDAQGAVVRWDVAAREFLSPLGGGREYSHVAFSDDGAVVAVTGDGELSVWEVTGDKLLFKQPVTLNETSRVAITRDGRTVAWTLTSDQATELVLCDMQSGKTSRIPKSQDTSETWPVFSPDGRQLTVQRYGTATTQLWNVSLDPPAQRYEVSGWGPERCAAFSPDGNILAIGSYNNDIRLYEAESGILKQTLQGHTEQVLSLAFSRDGRRLVSGGDDGTVRIWAIERDQGHLTATFPGQAGGVISVAYSPAGDSVASLAGDGTIKVWRAASRQEAEQDVEERIDRAVDYFFGHQLDKAIQEIKAAIERFPGNQEARVVEMLINGKPR